MELWQGGADSMKKKEKELGNIFGRYIDINKVGLSEPNEAKQSNRLLISISCSEKSNIRFSNDLYNHISCNFPFDDNILVDSLSPVPLLSAPLENVSGDGVERLLRRIIGPNRAFRVVCAIGAVQFGKIGQSNIISYGSSGQLVSSVLEGAVIFPPRFSWGDEIICNLLKIPLMEAQKISGINFFRLENY